MASSTFAFSPTKDTDELIPSTSAAVPSVRRGFPAGTAIGLGLTAALGMTALIAGVWPPASPAAHESPLTVRALLASDELKDVTTDNLIALHGDVLASSGREHVREQVNRGFARIDAALEQMQPESHRQLSELELTGQQKESAMRVLRKFGDARMVGLSRAISAAIDENVRESGDSKALERRLFEKLSANIGDVAQLNSEMFPNKPISVDMESAVPAHAQLKADFEKDAHASAMRRLAVLDGISGGVNAHAQTLFESLQGELGEKMPSAPARMLSMFGPQPTTQTKQNDQSFMSCIQAALPDPTKLAKCLADNMSEVISMLMNFMKGKSPPAR